MCLRAEHTGKPGCETCKQTWNTKLIELCQTTELRIANDRIENDKGIGKCTYFDRHGGSLLDYVLVSESLLYKLRSFDVHDLCILSDHCMLSYCLNANVLNPKEPISEEIVPNKYFRWNNEKENDFVEKLKCDEVQVKLNEICTTTGKHIM